MISNRVYTATVGKDIDLLHPDLLKLPNYKPPFHPDLLKMTDYTPPKKMGRFPGASLKLTGATFLLFKNGKVVINGTKTQPDELEFALETGLNLTNIKLSHCSGYMKVGELNLPQLKLKIKNSIYEPELHPGLHFKLDRVSVIAYTTGTIMICGIRNDEHLYDIKCEVLNLICK